MKKSRFTDSQIMAILKRAESCATVTEICRKEGISPALFYRWLSKSLGWIYPYGQTPQRTRSWNARLKKMYSQERLRLTVHTVHIVG